jgi:hypothetical protein
MENGERRTRPSKTAQSVGSRSGENIFNPDGFALFWDAYPNRTGRLAAIKAWNKARPDDALVAQMLKTLAWQRCSEQWGRGYIPHPTTWLNQGRWDDEPVDPPMQQLSKHTAALLSAVAGLSRERT